MFTVYILYSNKTGRHYIGYTSDLKKRLLYHNSGKNRSTKTGAPWQFWQLMYKELFSEKKDAWLREHQIKSYKGGGAFKKLLQIN